MENNLLEQVLSSVHVLLMCTVFPGLCLRKNIVIRNCKRMKPNHWQEYVENTLMDSTGESEKRKEAGKKLKRRV